VTAECTIGQVIAELSAEFPDLRESKIRYLETEGLIAPSRTRSGYRAYSAEDVEKLRSILRLQRDNFWPLRVIREHLNSTPSVNVASPTRTQRPIRKGQRISAATLQSRSGIDAKALADLISFGLVIPDPDGRFEDSAAEVCQVVAALGGYGIEPRHLRSARVAADREVGLVRQALAGIDGKGADGRQRRVEGRTAVLDLVVSLHEALIRTGLSQD
jgi:DNA-binding transcriptional MerR regulator